MIDPNNPVVALCAAGMAIEGEAERAKELFEQAWEARTDDYDASIAAHFLARHQPTSALRLHWNALAAEHAESVTDGRADLFKASLYLNLADSLESTGDRVQAACALEKALVHLCDLPEDGYRSFVAQGIAHVETRLTEARTR